MRFKNIKPGNLTAYLITAMIYPLYKFISAEKEPLMDLINACLIVGMVFLVLGILNSMVLHGDFDITEYVTRRIFSKKEYKTYSSFKEDKAEAHKEGFNYPLFTGLLFTALSIILTFVYNGRLGL